MQIRLKSYSFELSAPFQAGTVLTAAEAQALNGLRAENICNTMRKELDKQTAVLPDGQLLDAQALADMQSKITAYDRNYQFVSKHEPKTRRGALEAMIWEVAQQVAEAEAARNGKIADAELEFNIKELCLDKEIQAEARKRLAERQSLVGTVEELL